MRREQFNRNMQEALREQGEAHNESGKDLQQKLKVTTNKKTNNSLAADIKFFTIIGAFLILFVVFFIHISDKDEAVDQQSYSAEQDSMEDINPYLREAYVPHDDNSCRLTMDRQVCSDPEPVLRLCTKMVNPICVWGEAVVVELKFTNRFPNWFGDLVRVFGLKQCGAAKYADGVSLLDGRMPRHKHMPGETQSLGWDDTIRDAKDRPSPLGCTGAARREGALEPQPLTGSRDFVSQS